MSEWLDAAHDAGYRGEEARQAAQMLEEQERERYEAREDAMREDPEPERSRADDVVAQVGTRLQALAAHWGHPAWSECWAQQVAREALTAAHEADPIILAADVNPEAVICLDCEGWPKPSCDVSGHGLTTLDELMTTYRGEPKLPACSRCGGSGLIEFMNMHPEDYEPPMTCEACGGAGHFAATYPRRLAVSLVFIGCSGALSFGFPSRRSRVRGPSSAFFPLALRAHRIALAPVL